MSSRPQVVDGRRRRLLTAACTFGGVALFAYVVRRTGLAEIADGIGRVGWGLAAILALGGFRFMLRAASWRLCLAPDTALTYRQALLAFVAGDAFGNLTPLGLLASEPAKILLTRRHLAPRESVASLAVENLIYAVSVVGMVAIGLLVVVATVPLAVAVRWWIAAVLLGFMVAGVVVLGLRRGTWDSSRRARPRWRQRLAELRLAVVGYSTDPSTRLWRALALDLVFHVTAVLEVFVTLRWLLGDLSPTLGQAVAFETLNRVVTVVFKFVPFRIGVDEALSAAVAPMLAVNPAAGVSLAVIRKIRSLFWSAVGLGIMAAHPSTTR